MSKISLSAASISDLPCILDLQRLAYQSEAKIYNDWSLPALTQTLEELRAEFAQSVFYKACLQDEIVGSVRAMEHRGVCKIGRLIVLPGQQGLGIGSMLLDVIEQQFAHVGRFELFTGSKSASNIHFYEGRGYSSFRVEPISNNVSIIFLEKINV